MAPLTAQKFDRQRKVNLLYDNIIYIDLTASDKSYCHILFRKFNFVLIRILWRRGQKKPEFRLQFMRVKTQAPVTPKPDPPRTNDLLLQSCSLP